MYTLWKLLSRRELLVEQAPTLISSLLIAELFYKFGSFSLETIAFLVTWFALDAVLQAAIKVHDQLTDPTEELV